MKKKPILARSFETILLAKPYKHFQELDQIEVYKSLLPNLRKDGYILDGNHCLDIYPLYNFLYVNNKQSLRFYKQEELRVKAAIAAEMKRHENVHLIDAVEVSENEPLFELYKESKHHTLCEEVIQPIEPPKHEEPLHYFIVTLKGGHVGKHLYYPMRIPMVGYSKVEVIARAIQLPRVKHKSKNDVLDIQEVDQATFYEQYQANLQNEYYQIRNNYDGKTWRKAHRHEFEKDILE